MTRDRAGRVSAREFSTLLQHGILPIISAPMRWNNPIAAATATLFGLFVAGTALADDPLSLARTHRTLRGSEILHEFAEFLSLPNVASDSVGIRNNAVWIREELQKRGVTVTFLEVPGAPPIVLGRLDAPGQTR